MRRMLPIIAIAILLPIISVASPRHLYPDASVQSKTIHPQSTNGVIAIDFVVESGGATEIFRCDSTQDNFSFCLNCISIGDIFTFIGTPTSSDSDEQFVRLDRILIQFDEVQGQDPSPPPDGDNGR